MVGRLNPNWIVPTAPRGTSDNRAASTAFVTGGGSGGRIVLPSSLYPGNVFYVATNGVDVATGGTAAAPWLTFAYAMSQLTSVFDFGGQTVTLQAVAGHAAFTQTLNVTGWTGGGSFVYDGGGGSITAANSIYISGTIPGQFMPQNVTLVSTNGICLYMNGIGVVTIGTGVTFGACTNVHIFCGVGAQVNGPQGDHYTISGDASFTHVDVNSGTVFLGNCGIVFVGTRTFNVFVQAVFSGLIVFGNNTFKDSVSGGTPTVHASKFAASLNGVIYTGGAGVNYLPGNSPGSTSSGGQYL
jgi:hypothetical protein